MNSHILLYNDSDPIGNCETLSRKELAFCTAAVKQTPIIVKRFIKSHTQIIGLSLAALGQIIIGFAGSNITMIIIGWTVASLGTGIAVTLPFAMLSDTVDYGEWKNGVRASGFLTAVGISFCIKLGAGLDRNWRQD